MLSSTSVSPGARDLLLYRPGTDNTATPLVATAEYAEQGPSVSPDGRWLAYVSNETGRDEVFVRPFPDVEAGKVQVSRNGGFGPLWSRARQELFYHDGADNLVTTRFDTGGGFRVAEQETLFTIPDGYLLAAGNNGIDVAADGQRFLMGRSLSITGVEGDAPRLVLVQNFSVELRRRVPR